MWREVINLVQDPRNLFEVLVLFLILWVTLTLLRGTRGEGMVKTLGLLLAVGFLVLRSVAIGYGLDRLTLVLDAIFQASVVALVVIFQPELRRGLAMRIGQGWLSDNAAASEVIEEVVAACDRMAKNHPPIGALIAFERKDSLKAFVDKGTVVDADVNDNLLVTLFTVGTPLHDGAVIIQNGRIAAAGCFLPNTDNPEVPKHLGTRHRAAIGLSEETDALVIVVSEETGIISVADGGRLDRDFDRETLFAVLQERYLAEERPREDEEDEGVSIRDGSPTPPGTPGKATTRVTRRIVAP